MGISRRPCQRHISLFQNSSNVSVSEGATSVHCRCFRCTEDPVEIGDDSGIFGSDDDDTDGIFGDVGEDDDSLFDSTDSDDHDDSALTSDETEMEDIPDEVEENHHLLDLLSHPRIRISMMTMMILTSTPSLDEVKSLDDEDSFEDELEEIDPKEMHGEGGYATEWMEQPKMKRMFQEIEHRLDGVLWQRPV